MSQIKTALFVVISLIFSLESFAQSGGSSSSGGSWSKRASAREGKRWTLQEWLDTKNRNAMMDQWLVMNSPSPYEFFIKAESYSYESKTDSNTAKTYNTISGSFAAYAQAIGISGEHENNHSENLNDTSGLLNVRLMGNSLQTTALTLSIGQRTRELEYNNQTETVRNLFGQAQLQVYITRFFGIKGLYRKYQETSHSVLGDVGGNLTEGGLFIDFSGLRVFGDWYNEEQTITPTAGDSTTKRTGVKTGLQIFF